MGKLHFRLQLLAATCLVICSIPSTVVAVVQIVTFTNPTPIENADGALDVTSGLAASFSSTINIEMSGAINDVNGHIDGISHTFPNDIGALLVGPGGQNAALFVPPDSGNDIAALDWTFDDSAAGPRPTTGKLVSRTFDPSNYSASTSLGAPAPLSAYGTALSVFNGTDLLGLWNQYVQEVIGHDTGSIGFGRSLEIDCTPAATVAAPEPLSVVIWSLLGLTTVGTIKLRSWNRCAKASV